jgi:hypothetical protein
MKNGIHARVSRSGNANDRARERCSPSPTSSRHRSYPSISMRPAPGRSTPAISRSNVDLPQPLGPTSSVRPRGIRRSTCSDVAGGSRGSSPPALARRRPRHVSGPAAARRGGDRGRRRAPLRPSSSCRAGPGPPAHARRVQGDGRAQQRADPGVAPGREGGRGGEQGGADEVLPAGLRLDRRPPGVVAPRAAGDPGRQPRWRRRRRTRGRPSGSRTSHAPTSSR